MSIFNVTNDNNYMNSIFSSLPTTGGASTNNFLGDYYAVQNGSYYKLAKQFYAKAAAEEKAGKEADEKSLEMVKTGTEDALQSLSKLMDSNLFKKVETTEEKTTKDETTEEETTEEETTEKETTEEKTTEEETTEEETTEEETTEEETTEADDAGEGEPEGGDGAEDIDDTDE